MDPKVNVKENFEPYHAYFAINGTTPYGPESIVLQAREYVEHSNDYAIFLAENEVFFEGDFVILDPGICREIHGTPETTMDGGFHYGTKREIEEGMGYNLYFFDGMNHHINCRCDIECPGNFECEECGKSVRNTVKDYRGLEYCSLECLNEGNYA